MTTKYFFSPSTNSNSQAVIDFCLHVSKSLDQLKQTHARLLRTQPHDQDQLLIHLISRLLQLKGNHLHYARQLFEQIPHCENQFLWTSLIRSHARHGQFSLSITFYTKMHQAGVYPNGFTFSSVLSACARIPAIREGKQTHTRIVESGLFGNKVVQTSLLDMYAKCGLAEDARKVFDRMIDRDVVAWTAMISGYAKTGMMNDARRLFEVMVERNVVSWTAMVAGYANIGDITAAKELFDEMPARNPVTWTAMIAGYGKCGDVMKAQEVFNEIPVRVRDASSWAVMIACYAQNGYSKEAIEMYKSMRESNVKASEVAMVGVISACTQIGDVDTAYLITDHVEKEGHDGSLIVSNALIHMHAKCGSMDRAFSEFYRMPDRDVISYSALITALADHGRGNEALELFSRMLQERIKPNQVTFVGVLHACSHAGLVDEGCKYFDLMTKTYAVVPLTEHYACMVDLLGRAGRLNEAYSLILENVGTTDAGVWGALLGGCRVHGNVELGEIAAKHLFEIEPENTGNYVLLAHIYASVDRWDDAERVRKMISEKGIKKSPGRSWISGGREAETQHVITKTSPKMATSDA